ncbi:hypothetical protein SAMN04488491_2150 [Psychrobacter sp. LV10R520-6]|nr:hypothetical protein SAMN04488491_2150 [Psychrobacter sp. LV10R520-6]
MSMKRVNVSSRNFFVSLIGDILTRENFYSQRNVLDIYCKKPLQASYHKRQTEKSPIAMIGLFDATLISLILCNFAKVLISDAE